mgnify:FL=1
MIFSAGIKIPTPIKRREFDEIYSPLKSQNFDEIAGFLTGSCEGAYASHNFAFEITFSQAITLTLLLVCDFSPKVQKYLLGSPFLTIFRVPEKTQKVAKL